MGKVYKKTNDSIRFAARKVSNETDGRKMTDAEIVEAVTAELGWPLKPELQQERIAIRAFRENRQDAERASKGAQ